MAKNLTFEETFIAAFIGCTIAITGYNVMSDTLSKESQKMGELQRGVKELLKRSTLELKTEDVIGEKAPETFYEINGQKCYLEIDGKPLADYIKIREKEAPSNFHGW